MPTTPPRTRRTGRLALLSLTTVLATTAACVSNQPAPDDTPTHPDHPTQILIVSTQCERHRADQPTRKSDQPGDRHRDHHPHHRRRRNRHRRAERQPHRPRPGRPTTPDVTLDDFNGVEKVGELPRPLTMDGVPAGADPEINDIGYYRPSNGLVFYYGDVGYFNGIVRIGRLSAADMQLIRRQAGTFTINIEEG